jgi:hypothetical protein
MSAATLVYVALGWAVVSMISGPLIGHHLRRISTEVVLRIGPDGSLDDAVVAPHRCMSQ